MYKQNPAGNFIDKTIIQQMTIDLWCKKICINQKYFVIWILFSINWDGDLLNLLSDDCTKKEVTHGNSK
jgi:exosome complex RNA-binding protein Rrp42 (RNase PH superfamily)